MSPVTRARANPATVRDEHPFWPVDAAHPARPRAGDILLITRAASVQFQTPMLFRVIRVHDWPTYTGWLWLDGYQLDAVGDAVERRSIFVQASGLQRAAPPARRPRPRRGHAPDPPTELATRKTAADYHRR